MRNQPPCRYGNPCFIRAFRHIRLQPPVLLDATQICWNVKDQCVRGGKGCGRRFQNMQETANNLNLVTPSVQKNWRALLLERKWQRESKCHRKRSSHTLQELNMFVSVRLSIHTFHYPKMTLGQKTSLELVYFGLSVFCSRIDDISMFYIPAAFWNSHRPAPP
jgi:hypothetical protein